MRNPFSTLPVSWFLVGLVAALFQGTAGATPQLVTRGGGTVELASQKVDATLEAGLANVRVKQVFRYSGPGPVEAIYQFAVPEAAAMTGLTMTAGGERLEGILAERKRARRTYDEIVRRRRDPALLEKVGDGLYRLSVFPVTPGIDTVIELEYVERVPLTDGAYRMTVPLGGQASRGANTVANVTVRSYRDLGDVTASMEGAQVVKKGPRSALVSLEEGPDAGLPDGLLVTAALAGGEPSFDVEAHRDGEGNGWFVGVYSPGTPDPDALLPRDIVLVLDTSGSMKGEKIFEAKRAATWFVDQATERDRINIVRFSSDVTSVFPELTPVTDAARATLLEAIDGFVAEGSTALQDAILSVAETPADPGRARSVVLLTDGRPTLGGTDPTELIENVVPIAEAGFRVATFGVGDDVDAALLRGMAAVAGGHSEVFSNVLEIEARLRRFVTRTSEPALRDVRLSAEGVALRELYPRSHAVAYLGEQLIVTGRFEGHGAAEFVLEGVSGDGPVRLTKQVTIPAEASGRSSVALQFASQKLTELDAAQRLHSELGAEAYSVAARRWSAIDRGMYSTKEELTAEMIATSLRFGVQCTYTSFLALEARDRARFQRPKEGAQEEGMEEELEEEPILEEFEIFDHNETDTEEEFESTEGRPGLTADSPFDGDSTNSILGIGGGGAGRYAGRFGGRKNLRASGGKGTGQTIRDGLRWLQGSAVDSESTGEAPSIEAVRDAALAVLAYSGDGHTMVRGPFKGAVTARVKLLIRAQELESGRFTEPGEGAELAQLLATLALAELYYFDKSVLVRGRVFKAMGCIRGWLESPEHRARLSDEAIVLSLELLELDQLLHGKRGLVPVVRAEVERRRQLDPANVLLEAAALRFAVRPTDRAAQALAEGALDRFLDRSVWTQRGVDAADADVSLRLWLLTDQFRALDGAAWATWWKRLSGCLLETQRKDGWAKGSWQSVTGAASSGHAQPEPAAGAMARTALHVLALSAPFRFAPDPR